MKAAITTTMTMKRTMATTMAWTATTWVRLILEIVSCPYRWNGPSMHRTRPSFGYCLEVTTMAVANIIWRKKSR